MQGLGFRSFCLSHSWMWGVGWKTSGPLFPGERLAWPTDWLAAAPSSFWKGLTFLHRSCQERVKPEKK